MLAWMVYALVVSLLLGLAAACAEQLAVARGSSTRAAWLAAIALSCLLPLGGTELLGRLSERLRPALPKQVAVWERVATRQLATERWVAPLARPVSQPVRVEDLLTVLWWTSSALALVAVGWPSVALMRRRRLWQQASVLGVTVLVSDSEGPAVIGHWKPRIVVPRWLLEAPRVQQQAVLAHEQQHIKAHDSIWILLALAAIVSMPWCLPLWWQLRRLRRAIEVDCDARVLAGGMDRRQYGETLIAVGERQMACPVGAAGMAERHAFLERRMTLLYRVIHRRWSTSALVLAALSISLVGMAAEVRPSAENAAEQSATLAAPREAYTGFFKFANHEVLWLHVKGSNLIGTLTGFESVPLTVAGPYRLVAHDGAVRIDFHPRAAGHLDGVTLTLAEQPQEGRRISAEEASENEAWIHKHVAERIELNRPYTGGAVTLQSLEKGLIDGSPPYGLMTAAMVMTMRAQLPILQKALASSGEIESITFKDVDEMGWDRYDIRRTSAVDRWAIEIDEQGHVSGARLLPPPST